MWPAHKRRLWGGSKYELPLKTPAWEARWPLTRNIKRKNTSNICRLKSGRGRLRVTNVIQSPKKGFYPCPIAITFSPLTDFGLKFVKMQC